MNELIIYGICVALTIALLVVLVRRKGFEVLLPLIMVPPLLATFITRDPTNLFHPNGSNPKPLTRVLSTFFALLIVPLLGSVLYGLYCTSAWLVATEIAVQTGQVAPGTGTLLAVNTGLWLLSAALVVLLLVHLGQSWKWIFGMNSGRILFGYATALVMHGLGFVVLAATRNHLLLHVPGAGEFPGFGVAAAAIGCANLLVFTLVRNLLGYQSLLAKAQVPAERTLKLFRGLSLLHAGLLGYFLVRVFLAVFVVRYWLFDLYYMGSRGADDNRTLH